MAGRVVVVGMGPAGPEHLTQAASSAISGSRHRFVRTSRHPSASAIPEAASFDEVYETSSSLEEVYGRIVQELLEAAESHGQVLYAVPGSPHVAERTVELLLAQDGVEVEIVPGLSFLDLVWDRVGVDPVGAGVRVVDGHRFEVEAAGERGPLLVVQCDSPNVLSDVKLSVEEGPEVLVLQRLGLPDEVVTRVAWADLDRVVAPDHLTSLWVPVMAAPVAGELVALAQLVRELRERCPWDRQQTHQTLTRHLLEETYEVLEAISGLPASFDHLEEELGDVLFQVVFHAALAAEEGHFDLADVARGVHDKLVVRHPHVFGEVVAETPGAVMANWERIKQAEKSRDSLMDGIPGELPSLLHAHKVQRKAASVGFDWPSPEGVYPKVVEELAEVRRAAETAGRGAGGDEVVAEVGDLLFTVVNLARHLSVDAEAALRAAASRFADRFRAMERMAAERGLDLVAADAGVLDGLWEEVKGGR